MNAEIITIGDELLIGQVIDTNSAWMGQQLNSIGIRVAQITSVSDNREHILQTLAEASLRAQVILITGGLGPTKDDITKFTLCEYFNTSLVFHEEAFKDIEGFFFGRGIAITEMNRLQAMLPEACIAIRNPVGTARGMWFEKDGCIYVSMPGVPFEMKAIMTDYVLPELLRRFADQAIVHKTIMTTGIGESFLAAKIESWEDALPSNMKLAYLPSPGIVRLRITASGNDRQKIEKEVEEQVNKLLPLASEYIYGFDDQQLEEVIGKMLLANDLSLSTAESCTGGFLAHLITSIPGSSAYFTGAVVSYSNQVKMNQLGVSYSSLVRSGAVSEEVVRQMAEGVRNLMQTSYAVGISGIAGPDGGTAEKPVGLVWIAIAGPGGTIAKEFRFGDNRERNIRRAALAALNMLRKILLNHK